MKFPNILCVSNLDAQAGEILPVKKEREMERKREHVGRIRRSDVRSIRAREMRRVFRARTRWGNSRNGRAR